MKPLFDLVLRHVPAPTVEEGPFRLLGTILEANPYLGRVVTGRIISGSVKPNQPAKVLDANGNVDRAGPHLQGAGVPRTRAHARSTKPLPATSCRSPVCRKPPWRTRSARRKSMEPLPAQPIDPPTLAMTFRVNDSPLAGTEGIKVTSRMIRDRLLREAEGNVALRVSRIRRQGLDGSRRPRRIAARHPDRDHAPRGLRIVGVAAQGAAAPQRGRRDWKSRSKRS